MKHPTVKQAQKLKALGGGAIALAPGRGDWGPLLRRGWVEPVMPDDANKRFLPPLRITAGGLRALASAVEAHPELRPEIRPRDFEQLNEPPAVTRLKADLAKARDERDRAQRDLSFVRGALSRCQRVIEPIVGALDG
jgi:hypothetical protein